MLEYGPQQPLLNENAPSSLQTLIQSTKCRSVWDQREARFERCFLPIISLAPGIVAIVVLVARIFRSWLRRRPLWLRDFIDEKPKKDESPASSTTEAKHKFTPATLISLAFCCIGMILDLAALLWPPTDMLVLLPTVSWATTILLLLIGRPRCAPLGPLVILLTIFFTKLTLHLNAAPIVPVESIPSIVATVMALAAIVQMLNIPLRDPATRSPSSSAPFNGVTHELSSPEDNLTPWQFMSVTWMSPLMSIGSKRQLEDTDVWSLPVNFQHSELHSRFRDLKGSLVWKLFQANGLDLCILSSLALVSLVLRFCGPALLQLLLRSLEDELADTRAAIVYATIALSVRLARNQLDVFGTWYGRRCYERSRGEMITMLHEKVLARKIIGANAAGDKDGEGDDKGKAQGKDDKDDKDNNKPASMGKIFNLMKYDAYEIAQRFWEIEDLVDTPLGLVVSVVLVWQMVGWPALFGVVTVVIAQVLNVGITRLLLRWERVRRAATDTRLQKSTQYVEAIRHLRWYGWQDHWLEGILKARSEELRQRVKTSMLRVIIDFTNAAGGYLFPVAAFYAYTSWAGLPLRLDIAFPALQLFTYVEWYLMEVPNLITTLLNARIAVARIEAFMREPDVEEEGGEMVTLTGADDATVELKEAGFAWPGNQENVLHDLSLKFSTGMTVILGEVGSGKTALLQALLGEMDITAGHVTKPNAMMGYCAQTPWLQSMSIKDNILFSYPFEEERYKQVLETCQLNPDLDSFVDGDRSLIGENGIGLSGGQRARVALARAVYSRSKILVFDDPLSALDHQTADAIVKKCFRGRLMDGRTLILVTHRVELVQHLAEQLVEVSAGAARILDPRTDIRGLARTGTNESKDSTDDMKTAKKEDEDVKAAEKFIEDEKRVHGGVKARVYWEYIKAGKIRWWLLLILVMVLGKGIDVGFSYFLKEWAEAYDDRPSITDIVSDVFHRFPSPDRDVAPWLWAFLVIAIIQSFLYTSLSVVGVLLTYTAGKEMFKDILVKVSNATFRFYDVTPVGRLMNRLTADVGTIDGGLSRQLRMVVILSIQWIAAVLVIASVTPIFLVFSVVLSATFVLIFRQFLPTSQSLRRLEMVSLSPLMSNFGALLHGLTTVRAFKSQSLFQSRVITVTDDFQKQDHFFWSLQAWLSYRFNALSALSNFLLVVLALYTGITPGLTAFLLNSATQYISATHALCKRYGQLQMDFVSVERIVELLHLEQEPTGHINPPAAWPPLGASINFENVTISYAPHLEPALKDITLRIPGGSTTALIGRTGSGKSTLALSLLSTIPLTNGTITLADLPVNEIHTLALRQRITFLAQDPILFPGTIRQNLDPLSLHSDADCTSVLERIAPPHKHHWTLSTPIEPGGANLSQGQRQLVGLARALLRRSAVVIMDEATASIDTETAGNVLGVLREELKGATVLVVAHRVEGVRGADWWIRLDGGRVAGQGKVVNGKVMDAEEVVDGEENGVETRGPTGGEE